MAPAARTSAAETTTATSWMRAQPPATTAPNAVPTAIPAAPPTPSGRVIQGLSPRKNDRIRPAPAFQNVRLSSYAACSACSASARAGP